MKKTLVGLSMCIVILCTFGLAHATLLTIGTAQYDPDGVGGVDPIGKFNLIWDDDNNGNSVVWLDYTNGLNTWQNQLDWALGLASKLKIKLFKGYTVAWEDDSWRLPSMVDGPSVFGYKGPDENGDYNYTKGFNLANSEIGHLYYEELSNLGWLGTDGIYLGSGYGLLTTGSFDNLINWGWYWSGTEYAVSPDLAWMFHITAGEQGLNIISTDRGFGLALRSGEVSKSPVPEPTTILLFGTGLAGLAAVGRRKRD